MIPRRQYALRTARQWRELTFSAAEFRDKFKLQGRDREAGFWQGEYNDRLERAVYWQWLADGPAWRRWFQ